MKRHPEDEFLLADPYPMSPSARQALRGAIRVLCPPRPSFPDLEDRIELHVRRMLQYMPKAVALGFSLAALLVDWAPVWRFVALGRLGALPRDRAERVLTEMSTSRWSVVRTMLVAVRGLVLSTFYDQDEVHEAMRYRPMPFLTERVQAREQLLAIAPKPKPGRSDRAFDGGALA